jgi:hypothetical protein
VVDLFVGGSNHPAVVVDVDGEQYVLIYGTGTNRPDILRVAVDPQTRNGKALRLSKPTYFYKTNVRVAKMAALRSRYGRCPPGLFVELRELVDKAFSEMTPADKAQAVTEQPAKTTS